MNNRLELLHVYRAMASVAVVLHHLTAMSERGFGVEYLGGFFTAFELRVDFFFVLSGFLITGSMAIGVGSSRIYLGVHDMEDVLGGTLLGLASFVIYRGLVSDQFKAWHDLNPALQLAGIAALAPLLWFAWPRELPPSMLALVAFMLFWWLGKTVEQRWIRYERHANWAIAGAAAVVGIVGLFALMKVLGDQLLAAGLAKDLATIVPFAASSLFVTAVAPALFRLARAARTAP